MTLSLAPFVLALAVFLPATLCHPAVDSKGAQTVTISHDNPLILYHGRWTPEPSSWWSVAMIVGLAAQSHRFDGHSGQEQDSSST